MAHRKKHLACEKSAYPNSMGLFRKNRTKRAVTAARHQCIHDLLCSCPRFLSCLHNISVQHPHRSGTTSCKSIQNIKVYTISKRHRDRVAGAFVKKFTDAIPFQKMAGSMKFIGSVGLIRDLVINQISRCLLDHFHFFLFPSGDNRDIGFSDMGPMPSLISHKTAKNGIPAVRTIAFGTLFWKIIIFFKQYDRKCRCFLLDVADDCVPGALEFDSNAPISIFNPFNPKIKLPCTP